MNTSKIFSKIFQGAAAALVALGAVAACSESPTAVNPVSQVNKTSSTDNQQAAAGTVVPRSPEVTLLRADGEKAVGEAVTFSVTGGGGSVTDAVVVTDIRGTARPREWTLGQVAAANFLTATANNIQVEFTAIGVAGPAAGVVLSDGDEQTATVGTEVATRPEVQAVDQFGNGVQGVTITWKVLSGGGTVIGQSAMLSEPDGFAAVGGWELGPIPGENLLEASSTGFAPVEFKATGTP